MANYLYWFDCDLSMVHDREWLEGVMSTVAALLNCEPMYASSPADKGGETWKDWAPLFGKYPPTQESVFLMHGRTGRVDETLKSLWEASGERGEKLPRCRVVYSGGREWNHLESLFFPQSTARYCTIKANDFKWSAGEANVGDEKGRVAERFGWIVRQYVTETWTKEQRLRDVLAAAAERVYEAATYAAAAVVSGSDRDIDWSGVLKQLYFAPHLAEAQDDWPNTAQHEQMERIQSVLVACKKMFKLEDDEFKVDAGCLFSRLFDGGEGDPSLYKLIQDLDATLNA